MGNMRSNMIEIETPERLREAIRTLWDGKKKDLNEAIGRSAGYLNISLAEGRIQRGSFYALANALGVTAEKLMEYTVEPKPEEPAKEEPKDNEVLSMLTLIYEMEKRQVETLQRLNTMFERVWCK